MDASIAMGSLTAELGHQEFLSFTFRRSGGSFDPHQTELDQFAWSLMRRGQNAFRRFDFKQANPIRANKSLRNGKNIMRPAVARSPVADQSATTMKFECWRASIETLGDFASWEATAIALCIVRPSSSLRH